MGLSLQQKASFFHQLGALLKAGVPLQQSLSLVGKATPLGFQRQLQQVSQAIAQGENFATALTQQHLFDPWTLSLMQTAEYSGAFAWVCERIAIATERQQQQSRRYRSVALSLLAMGLSTVAVITIVLGRGLAALLTPIFGLLCLGLVGGFAAVVLQPSALVAVTYAVGRPLPIARKLLEAQSMLYLAELELPLSCGVPILAALDLIRARIPDAQLATTLAQASRQIRAGQSLTQSLQGKLPPLALQMIRTGEETGALEMLLQKLGVYYEGELERILGQLQGALKPLSIVAIGGVVLVSAIQTLSSLLNSLPG